MGFQSQDDLILQISSNGKYDPLIYQKVFPAAGMAGHWQHLIGGAGTPAAATFTGANCTLCRADGWTVKTKGLE